MKDSKGCTVTMEKDMKGKDNCSDSKCRCGCIPKNMSSLFEMAEKRKKYRESLAKDQEENSIIATTPGKEIK